MVGGSGSEDGSEAALIKVSKDLLAADAGDHMILMLAACSSAWPYSANQVWKNWNSSADSDLCETRFCNEPTFWEIRPLPIPSSHHRLPPYC